VGGACAGPADRLLDLWRDALHCSVTRAASTAVADHARRDEKQELGLSIFSSVARRIAEHGDAVSSGMPVRMKVRLFWMRRPGRGSGC